MNLRLSSLLLPFLAVPASAQAINIDFGDPFSPFAVPSNAHGAAAMQPGFWNGVDYASAGGSMFSSAPLMDLTGALTAVTIDADMPTGMNLLNFNFDDPNTSGDDEALMDDLNWVAGASTVDIIGLAAGTYTLYTYAMAPDSATGLTSVNVLGSVDPQVNVGGDFVAGYVRDVTHAEHTIVVAPGAMVTIELDLITYGDSLNGLQIVPTGPISIGSTYCAGVINSTGVSAALDVFGSATAADNNVSLNTSDLPQNSFTFSLTSQMQGLSMNPGGSQGNLCLGGQVGRYVGPGQVQGSGTMGEVSLMLDLTNTPQPTGSVSVMSGETWNFQTWYRDAISGVATSNFSNAVSVTFL